MVTVHPKVDMVEGEELKSNVDEQALDTKDDIGASANIKNNKEVNADISP